VLLISNVVVFLLERLLLGLESAFALHRQGVLAQPWTLVTYMFLHANTMHLLFNMLSLYFFGPRLEERLGSGAFGALYFVSGITGGLLSLVMSPSVGIVGASAAVFGVQLGFARYWPRDQILIWGVFPVEARLLVVLMTVLALFGGFTGSRDGIAHFAHLGGFLGGWLYLKLRDWRSPARQFRVKAGALERASAGLGSADLRRWEAIPREGLHVVNREEVERLLAKARASGPGSLTADERACLNRFSEG
jgi:membrane associated rhomboid family serine protease